MFFKKKDPFIAREEHYIRFFGEIDRVFHSTDEVEPHIDIYRFKPTDKRDYWVLITGGMSDELQSVPEGTPDFISRRTEILMYAKEPEDWMYGSLKHLAEFPFVEKTYFHWGHTVGNAGRPVTAAPSLLTNFFFVPPFFEKDKFDHLKINGEKIDFLWIIPITENELNFKINNGAEALIDEFAKHDFYILLDEKRQSLV